ncbi:GSK3B-interacting protein-like [Cylas formicarius]|uniref:GSK3B-interacting protein-like n=1 Tax=Cylas formicarius TaxID=197179 RepID=UPI002958DCD8|nr:GSK3B-interacting protein-like [Cylas formicarius]
MSERVLDAKTWRAEAEAVIEDVRDHATRIRVSDKVPATDSAVYIDVETLEGRELRVELSAKGFRVCGDPGPFFETPYSLLESVSPKFRQSFAAALAAKLVSVRDESSRVGNAALPLPTLDDDS